jgi:DNA-binding NarL/FixJ family response regulator
MTITGPTPPSLRPVHIEVSNVTVRLALCFVAEDAGFVRGSSTGAITVSDTMPSAHAPAPVDVLVIAARPLACQRALSALSQGTARAVICNDEPHRLPAARRAVNDELSVVPHRVIHCANRAPILSARLLRTLQLIAKGASNQNIARVTYDSLSTVKRNVTQLLEAFDAPNRMALTSTAIRLGYQLL